MRSHRNTCIDESDGSILVVTTRPDADLKRNLTGAPGISSEGIGSGKSSPSTSNGVMVLEALSETKRRPRVHCRGSAMQAYDERHEQKLHFRACKAQEKRDEIFT